MVVKYIMTEGMYNDCMEAADLYYQSIMEGLGYDVILEAPTDDELRHRMTHNAQQAKKHAIRGALSTAAGAGVGAGELAVGLPPLAGTALGVKGAYHGARTLYHGTKAGFNAGRLGARKAGRLISRKIKGEGSGDHTDNRDLEIVKQRIRDYRTGHPALIGEEAGAYV